MKNHLKTISLILILVLILGSFSGAFAQDNGTSVPVLSDIAGLSGQEQIQVCQSLGIVTGNPDGTYQPEKPLNRAEFAAMIVRTMGIHQSALKESAGSPFLDTDGYGWSVKYLAYCQARGIMLGDGKGNAMPGRTITVNEAITMILRALGYTDGAAVLSGKWPANYVNLGNEKGLYEGLSEETTINKENAAIAIYNALSVQLVTIDTYGTATPLWQDNGAPQVLLTSGLGCTADMNVVIGKDYSYDDALFNITEKIGDKGTAYVNKDGNLIAFAADTVLLKGKISGDTFKTLEKNYSFNQSNAQSFWQNFSTNGNVFVNTNLTTNLAVPNPMPTSTAKLLENLAKSNADGDQMILAAKVSGGTIKEVCSIVFWQTSDAELAEADAAQRITEDQELMGLEFAVGTDNLIDFKGFGLIGIDNVANIAEGNVLYAYVDSEGIVRKLAVGTDIAEGELSSVGSSYFSLKGRPLSYAGGKEGYLLNGLGYGFDDNDIKDEIGADVTVRLDAFGYAFDIETTGGYQGNMAVVLAAQSEGFDHAKLKVYSAVDGEKTYPLQWFDDLKVRPWDDKTIRIARTLVDLNNLIATLEPDTSGANILPSGFIGYVLDGAGTITEVDMGLTNAAISMISSSLLKYSAGGKTTTCAIAEEAAVLSYKTKDGELVIAAESFDSIDYKDAKTATYGAIFMNKANTKVIGILLPAAYMTAGDSNVYMVVNSVSSILDAQRIKGYANGEAVTLDTNDVNVITFNAGNIALYELDKNGTGKIQDAPKFAVNADGAAGAEVIVADKGVNVSDRLIKTTAQNYIVLAEDTIVYKATLKSGDWSYALSGLSAIGSGDTVYAYDTREAKDRDGTATVIIWHE